MSKNKKIIILILCAIIGALIPLVYFLINPSDIGGIAILQPIVGDIIILADIPNDFFKIFFVLSNTFIYLIYAFIIIKAWQKNEWNKEKKIFVISVVIIGLNLIAFMGFWCLIAKFFAFS